MTCGPTKSSPALDLPGAFDRQLKFLVKLAKEPGWKAYAWHRAKELDADTSGLFTGMAKALRDAMTGQDEAMESVDPYATKPRSVGTKSITP